MVTAKLMCSHGNHPIRDAGSEPERAPPSTHQGLLSKAGFLNLEMVPIIGEVSITIELSTAISVRVRILEDWSNFSSFKPVANLGDGHLKYLDQKDLDSLLEAVKHLSSESKRGRKPLALCLADLT